MTKLKMREVTSPTITKIGYVKDQSKLYIEFKNGKTFCYTGVPSAQFLKLSSAHSVGSYLNRHIKGSYQYTQVSGKTTSRDIILQLLVRHMTTFETIVGRMQCSVGEVELEIENTTCPTTIKRLKRHIREVRKEITLFGKKYDVLVRIKADIEEEWNEQ